MSRHWIRRSLVILIACWAVLLLRAFASTQPKVPQKGKSETVKTEKATTQDLGGADRYLTFISSDKPIYRSGEQIYFRGVMLNAANHKPMADGQSANPTISIKGPKGEVVAAGSARTEDSVWGFSWQIPDGQSGGEYTISASYPWEGHSPAERKFDIRSYRAPRLKSQIVFLRDGYGPGDKVTATLEVTRAEGGVPEGAKVNVNAMVDGTQINGAAGKVDAKGLCSVSFDLPQLIARGEGTLALVIEDGGVVETASKTIPILLQTVDLQTFPEGGDLIAGYKNRVYVQANQPNGKPADLAGKIMHKLKGQPDETVGEFRTQHEGRGRFEFTPGVNQEYFLSISQPAGIKTVYPLPTVKDAGAVIRADKDVYMKGQPVTVQVGCTDKTFQVTLAKREVEVSERKVVQTSDSARKHHTFKPISFKVPADADGVLTVTVWDEKGMPLAERLLFREEEKPLTISITADKKTYVPGDNAKITVKTTDADGKPVSATVGVTVTDDSVLEMIEKREQAPRLPVMVFLEPEVKDLADAHVYLDPNNPKAPLATDLLLGTQGWRRFALMDVGKFINADSDLAKRVLALETPNRPQTSGSADQIFGDEGAMGPVATFAAANAGGKDVLVGMHAHYQHYVPAAVSPVNGNLKARSREQPQPFAMNVPDTNAFQVEPTIVDERHYTSGRDERVQKMPFFLAAQPGPIAVGGMAGDGALNRGRAARMQMRIGSMGINNMVVIREYAHQVRADRKPTDRVDFAETLYWNAAVKTEPKTGEGTINFGLSDSVTTFRIFADGFADNGALGASNVGLKAVQPFYAEAKLPLEVTDGDQILLPINLINSTDSNLENADAKVDLKGDFNIAALIRKLQDSIAKGARLRWLLPINVGVGNGAKDFILTAKAGPYEDKVTRSISVKPNGFPIETAFGGIIEPGKPVLLKITIEKHVVPSSITSNTSVYPTPLANMTGALERMIQDPNGCFEQTSSTSYPLTMAQQYFLSHTGVDPKLIETSREKLDVGYKKLVGFWCPDRGYEWFGQDPGHEALTAFGLLHFNDMAQVREVDKNMIATTRAWLLKQKDGNGGFTRKRRALHSWIEDKDCSNGYILWALLETGQPAADLKPELNSLKKAASASQNNYVVALAANALYLAGDQSEAKKLMDRLVKMQKADGSVDGVKASIVGSGGESLEVEGTALATLAWLREPAYAGNVEKSIKFLADSCKAGRYGSTQATVLALRSIVTYDKQRARPKAPGKIQLYVDGQAIGDWVAFDKSSQEAIKLPDMSELLNAGEHKLELRMQGGAPMPYSLAVKYNTLTPASDKSCQVDLSVKLAQGKVLEGSSTEADVTVTNLTKEAVPTPVAIIGLPGGLEPRHDQLKELVKKGTIDSYEVLGREVVLYWRTLPGDAKVQVPISLIAAVPGKYTGPASRAYLYYTDEQKQWVDGMHVEIAAKD